MRQIRPLLILFQAAAFIGISALSCGQARKPPSVDDLLGPPRQRDATFNRLVTTIKAHRYISKDGLARLETTWEEELDKSRKVFQSAKSLAEVYYALLSLANSAHDAHGGFDLDRLPPFLNPSEWPGYEIKSLRFQPRYATGSDAVEFVVIDGIEGVVEAGSVLQSVNGGPVDRVRRSFYPWFHRGSSPHWLDQLFAEWLSRRHPSLSPPPNEDVQTYEFLLKSGDKIYPKLTWQKVKSCRPPHPICTLCESVPEYKKGFTLEFKGLNYCIFRPTDRNNVAVVHMLSFDYPAGKPPPSCFPEKYKQSNIESDPRNDPPRSWRERDHEALIDKLHDLDKNGVEAFVFDLRRTGGGIFHPDLISHFTAKDYSITTKSFHYSSAFRNPDDDWAVLERRDRTLGMGPFPHEIMNLCKRPGPSTIGIRYPIRELRSYKRHHPNSVFSRPIPFFCKTKGCYPADARYSGVEKPLGPVALILGPRCGSACDQFASILVDNDIVATSVGLPTAGASAPYRIRIPLRLEDDTEVRLEVTVGVGLQPVIISVDGMPSQDDVFLPVEQIQPLPAPLLSISSVSPNTGLPSGETSTVISGNSFVSGASVSFGGTAAASLEFRSSTRLNATAPPHPPGAVDVGVRNPDGQSATLRGGFSYEPETDAMIEAEAIECQVSGQVRNLSRPKTDVSSSTLGQMCSGFSPARLRKCTG